MEVNASPGLRGVEGVTQVDAAKQIVRFIEKILSQTVLKPGARAKLLQRLSAVVTSIVISEKHYVWTF